MRSGIEPTRTRLPGGPTTQSPQVCRSPIPEGDRTGPGPSVPLSLSFLEAEPPDDVLRHAQRRRGSIVAHVDYPDRLDSPDRGRGSAAAPSGDCVVRVLEDQADADFGHRGIIA